MVDSFFGVGSSVLELTELLALDGDLDVVLRALNKKGEIFKTRITKLIFMQNQNTSMQTLKGFMITNLDRSSSEEKSEWLTARNSFPTRPTDSKSVPASGSGSSTSS